MYKLPAVGNKIKREQFKYLVTTNVARAFSKFNTKCNSMPTALSKLFNTINVISAFSVGKRVKLVVL